MVMRTAHAEPTLGVLCMLGAEPPTQPCYDLPLHCRQRAKKKNHRAPQWVLLGRSLAAALQEVDAAHMLCMLCMLCECGAARWPTDRAPQ